MGGNLKVWGVLATQGITYVATANGWDRQASVSLAGRCAHVKPGKPWWASIAREDWPESLEESIDAVWDETHGDRQTELVVIGRHMDLARVEAALRSCLLSKRELAARPPETWQEVRITDGYTAAPRRKTCA